MGFTVSNWLLDIATGISPFFEFVNAVWSALPFVFRFVFCMLFAVAAGFAMIKNLIL